MAVKWHQFLYILDQASSVSVFSVSAWGKSRRTAVFHLMYIHGFQTALEPYYAPRGLLGTGLMQPHPTGGMVPQSVPIGGPR
ncbi:hypothetical protein KSP40_PGU003040 [Platanthera guangdongensis]|uniref:Uncharacterized protein n=1 Tax=Platanthera guangdongensis TaxID=2320717 RepID=A0ABR2LP09_9ASPA